VPRDYVFGYGSLFAATGLPAGEVCHLTEHRRVWNVAMDNSVDVPGYKAYVDPRDGSRPDVFVTYLNLDPAPGGRVNGVVFPVSSDELSALDARERNYERIDVTGNVEEAVSGRVWTYIGKPEGVARYERGMGEQRAVISRKYYDGVLAACAAAGASSRREFDQSTDPPPCPIMDLDRIDLD
jgi:cation transport regulator ChaC